MSINANEDIEHKQAIQDRLDRIWEDQTELRIQRNRLEDELRDNVLGKEEANWLKAQHFALGKALDALENQKNVLEKVSNHSNVSDKNDRSDSLSDTAVVIRELRKDDAELTHKLEKMIAFLTDDDKTTMLSSRLISYIKCREDILLEYHYILMNHIFDLQGHQK